MIYGLTLRLYSATLFQNFYNFERTKKSWLASPHMSDNEIKYVNARI